MYTWKDNVTTEELGKKKDTDISRRQEKPNCGWRLHQ